MDIRGKFNCTFSVSSISATSITARSYVKITTGQKGYYYADVFASKDESSHLDTSTFEVIEANWLYCEKSVNVGKGDRITINSSEYNLTNVVFEIITQQPCGRFFYEMYMKRLGSS
jgi:hypothetical protein